MAGGNLDRTHSTACEQRDAVGAATLDRLAPVWFAPTKAEVTGAPVVSDDALYFGDWSGRAYAVDRVTGKVRWTRDLPRQPQIYAGQIPASPSLATIGGEAAVIIDAGRYVWALRASDGTGIWHHEVGVPGDGRDPIEIEGSPAVVGESVIVGTDVHNDQKYRAGVVALSLADGSERWHWDPEAGKRAGGCGDVWGTPSVDVDAHLVVVGTGSCFHGRAWTRWSEAIVGLDLRTGKPQWSYQPRAELNNQDYDFAGAANLFSIGDRKVVGLGNKDGLYYVVDRTDGSLVWKTRVLTTDVGNQAGGADNGQLIIWFPPFTGGTYPKLRQVAYCKLDVGIGTAQSILVRGTDVYVASSRGSVYRYTEPFPTSADAEGGCGRKDATGAPLVDEVRKSVFIKAGEHGLATPAGLADAPNGGFYVSSVISGVINEYDSTGGFVRTILQPPAGDKLGEQPYTTGSPLGIATDRDGTLYYADIGVIVSKDGVGPGDHTGTVRRIRFVDGKPQPPETMATRLDFPDGLGVYYPPA
jgi:outer membrane protein assembly factor BamB